MAIQLDLTNCKDETTFKQLTGHDFKAVIALTGVYAVYTYDELAEGEGVLISTPNPFEAHILIMHEGLELTRIIDYNAQTIMNISFKLKKQRAGTGTLVLIEQILAAEKENFGQLTCNAIGGEYEPLFNGYSTWGKLGFSIVNNKLSKAIGIPSLDRYNKLLEQHGIPSMPIHELLAAKNIICTNGNIIKSGEDFWNAPGNGFPWSGAFDTGKGSVNRAILCAYINRKIEQLETELAKHQTEANLLSTLHNKNRLEQKIREIKQQINILSEKRCLLA
ncbi:hypothetical protein F0L74_20280 [Chitinophaga agrisoli]|uniref:Uncharacterized protein n=1 Tax=Chitinophaga agrisoli TaxID=2607653 RepID=A0A5B2VI04_9BACT|nr:hypothetical protein [Chitinophaga agrisoli]KAA2238564.1 hypothetical protein F0L74_20280 [Chitinophaga agrisoli]